MPPMTWRWKTKIKSKGKPRWVKKKNFWPLVLSHLDVTWFLYENINKDKKKVETDLDLSFFRSFLWIQFLLFFKKKLSQGKEKSRIQKKWMFTHLVIPFYLIGDKCNRTDMEKKLRWQDCKFRFKASISEQDLCMP